LPYTHGPGHALTRDGGFADASSGHLLAVVAFGPEEAAVARDAAGVALGDLRQAPEPGLAPVALQTPHT
jgi:hypothetical protein